MFCHQTHPWFELHGVPVPPEFCMEEMQVPPQGALTVDVCLLARECLHVFVDCDAAQRPDVHGNMHLGQGGVMAFPRAAAESSAMNPDTALHLSLGQSGGVCVLPRAAAG